MIKPLDPTIYDVRRVLTPRQLARLAQGRQPGRPIRFEMVARDSSPTIEFEVVPRETGLGADIRQVTVTAREGRRMLLGADLARLGVDRLLAIAAEAAGLSPEDSMAYRIGTGRPAVLTRAFCEEVVAIAEANPEKPRDAVAKAFGKSKRTASGYLAKAATYDDLAKRLEVLR